ncbi:MAG: hypothetical protein H0X37_14230 [Herpetosiphonaceae bacterium]|nr:hypothetical protein [Herpetosiphonaceae bacterium]
MSRNESVILIKALPGTVTSALDEVLASQGLVRAATRAIRADFTPLLNEPGEPLAFVLSEPQAEWLACWTSLALDAEWEVAETLARGLQQPVLCAIFAADRGMFAYRYWEDGDLRAEAVPLPGASALNEPGLLAELCHRGVPLALIDDLTNGWTREHIVLGYMHEVAHSAPNGADPITT